MEEYLTLDTKIISDKAVSTIMPAQNRHSVMPHYNVLIWFGSSCSLMFTKLGKILDIFKLSRSLFRFITDIH